MNSPTVAKTSGHKKVRRRGSPARLRDRVAVYVVDLQGLVVMRRSIGEVSGDPLSAGEVFDAKRCWGCLVRGRGCRKPCNAGRRRYEFFRCKVGKVRREQVRSTVFVHRPHGSARHQESCRLVKAKPQQLSSSCPAPAPVPAPAPDRAWFQLGIGDAIHMACPMASQWRTRKADVRPFRYSQASRDAGLQPQQVLRVVDHIEAKADILLKPALDPGEHVVVVVEPEKDQDP